MKEYTLNNGTQIYWVCPIHITGAFNLQVVKIISKSIYLTLRKNSRIDEYYSKKYNIVSFPKVPPTKPLYTYIN